jgi:pimeloyl-ACP methyl ester carboxylesterase
MMTQIETGYVDVDGGRLYYEVTGAGHPLVLVHGMLFDRRLWDEQVPVFAWHFRVVRYDMRGFGKSEISQFGSDADDINALVEHLGLERIYLVGLSMGAEAAHFFTLQHPEKVAALVEIGSGVIGWEASPEFEQHFGQFFQAAESGDYDRARRIFSEAWVDGTGPATPEFRERAHAIMQDYTFGHYVLEAQMRAAQEATAPAEPAPIEAEAPAAAAPGPSDEARMAAIRVPVLIVVGDRDQPGTLKSADALAAAFPNARKVVIPNAAHIIPLEQPEAFTQAVLDFLLAADGERNA